MLKHLTTISLLPGLTRPPALHRRRTVNRPGRPPRADAEGQRLLRDCVEERTFDPKEGSVTYLPDFRMFAGSVLGWSFSPKGYAGTSESPIPTELEVPLLDYGETLRPDFAVRELETASSATRWSRPGTPTARCPRSRPTRTR